MAEQAGLNLTWSHTPKTGFLITRLILCLLATIYYFTYTLTKVWKTKTEWIEKSMSRCRHRFLVIRILYVYRIKHLSCLMTKPTKWLCPRRRLRSAWASAQSDQESLLCVQWVDKGPSFLQADSEDSDQTGWIPRLIWVFLGRTCHFVGFDMRWLICLCRPWMAKITIPNFVQTNYFCYHTYYIQANTVFDVFKNRSGVRHILS